MTVKRTPHHDLEDIKEKFSNTDTLMITGTATRDSRAIGYSLEDVVRVVSELKPSDFTKSQTAQNPPNPNVWHDTYKTYDGARHLYLKFAGATLIDIVLTSFKDV